MTLVSMQVDAQGVGWLIIERPDALNALNQAVLEELNDLLTQISQSEEIRVLVITGRGRAFVAGADIASMCDMDVEQAYAFSQMGQQIFARLAALSQPSIAAINGYALGGGLELALACDLRLATDKAQLGQPEIGLGIIPGFGATQRLTRLVGVARAKELLFTGDSINAEQALQMGLVNRVVPAAELHDQVVQLAHRIASHSRVAMKTLKLSIDKGLFSSLDSGLQMEAKYFSSCFSTYDQKEGMEAFLQKRPAHFQDR